MWRHHPQNTSFLSLFGEFFSQQREICDRILRFQKTVSPFGDFSPKKITAFEVLTSKFAFIFIYFYVVRYMEKIW
jgi:hypothetical protein